MHSPAFERIQAVAFFGALALSTLGFLYVVREFIFPLVWAIILALLFHPLYVRLVHTLRGATSLAALTTMLIALLCVFVPLGALGTIIAKEGVALYTTLSQGGAEELARTVEDVPGASWALSHTGGSSETVVRSGAELLRSSSDAIAAQVVGIGTGTAQFVAKTAVMLYLLFFLLRDGTRIASYLMRMLPLGDTKELFLFSRFSTTVRAIAKGSLVVALAQGAAGALLLWVGGIPNPVLWGSIMSVLALIPAAGPALVWVPSALFAFATGNVTGAFIIALGGVIVISNLDNVLRAALLGRDTNMPDALILLSVLGGISTFGLAGVVLGPVVAALFLALWELFEREYRSELIERG